MPLVAHSELPTFKRLERDGHEVISTARAQSQDIRELHIGLLNLMPDAALQATERQFLRMVGSSNRIAQFYVHPFTIAGVERAGTAKEHVRAHYEDFSELQRAGLDALIVTGANVTEADITREGFWGPLTEVMDWASMNVCSTMCSCLASHAAFKHYHNIDRTHLSEKQWGVFSHRVIAKDHPLLQETNTRFDAPHSRFNDVSKLKMERAGLRVLVDSAEGGVLIATSPDGFRFVYYQGHPEYDVNSLLKEYKREVFRFIGGELTDYPPVPKNYFREEAFVLLTRYRDELLSAMEAQSPFPAFPEDEIAALVDITWADTGKAIVNNWLGLVYQLTDVDRKVPFMKGIDPNNPLALA
ncbi:MAG: homoserine O-succinyltransferase [Gammaproteobacteria bacterium]|nr:homoserine O-succinyltransferase [Gammaproteobacteria bacterium]